MDRSVLLGAGLFALAITGACGPLGDQRWEGPADACTSGTNDQRVILLLDGPVVMPRVSGMVGVMHNSDNYTVAEFDDGEATPTTLKIKATFRVGNSSERWELDLESGPGGGYKGDLDMTSGGNTAKCDLELKRE